MISLIDTHCHLDLLIASATGTPPTAVAHEQVSEIVREAAHHGVHQMITVGTHLSDSRYGIALAAKTPAISVAIGIHPTELTEGWHTDINELKKLLYEKERNKVVAIGECGIDLYHHTSSLSAQQELFTAQIELALTHQLPLIIHSRNAPEETLRALDSFAQFTAESSAGIIHCFSYTYAYAQEFVQRGFALGIGGAVTYPKNHELRTVAQTVPLAMLVLETDAPFLAPQEIRGQQNHPREVARIATYIAQLRTLPVEEVAEATTATATRICNLSLH